MRAFMINRPSIDCMQYLCDIYATGTTRHTTRRAYLLKPCMMICLIYIVAKVAAGRAARFQDQNVCRVGIFSLK